MNLKFILNYAKRCRPWVRFRSAFLRRTQFWHFSRADTLRFTIILTTCKCNFNFGDRIMQHWKIIETWKKIAVTLLLREVTFGILQISLNFSLVLLIHPGGNQTHNIIIATEISHSSRISRTCYCAQLTNIMHSIIVKSKVLSLVTKSVKRKQITM